MVNTSSIKVLFVSRAHPPVIGGIERHNLEIARALGKITNIEVIANRKGKKYLLPFLFYAAYRTLKDAKKFDVILLGDGVLAILGFLTKRMLSKPVVCTIHGLDITYRNSAYQFLWTKYFLPSIDSYIPVSQETMNQCLKRGLDKRRANIIRNGVECSDNGSHYSQGDLENLIGRSVRGPMLLTLGRLVERKGVEWFIRCVMPLLPSNVTYIVAGDGKSKPSILRAIADRNLSERVTFLGTVSDAQKQILLHTVDLFVQPNIPVPGDLEGFGLTVLEAAAAGRVVVASRLEGLKDAIQNDKNGILVDPSNAESYSRVITHLLQNPKELQDRGNAAIMHVKKHSSWSSVAREYLAVLEEACRKFQLP